MTRKVAQFESRPGRVFIRASSTPTVLDCARRWAGRNLKAMLMDAGWPVRDVPIHCGAPIGTGVHALAAELLRGKRDEGQLPPFERAEEVGMAAMNEAFGEGDILWDSTVRKGWGRVDAQRQLQRMGLVYADQIAAFADPILIEKRLEAPWLEVPGYIITGQLDNLLRLDSLAGLHDLKTGSSPGGAAAQIGCYVKLGENEGYLIGETAIDFIGRVPFTSAQPGARILPVDRDAAIRHADHAIDKAVTATQKFIVDGDIEHFEANPSSALCKDRFCPLWGTKSCRVHLGEPKKG